MINAKKIVGRIEGLKCEDSVIQPFKNIGKQVATTALLGVLIESTSLLSAAPILILASKGRRAKTFTFKIDGIDVIGQFTTVKFNVGDEKFGFTVKVKELVRNSYNTNFTIMVSLILFSAKINQKSKDVLKNFGIVLPLFWIFR